MHPLDIISESPTFFILQKESNKTNFGGLLIVFYSIAMIGIMVFLGSKYYIEESYEVQSLSHFNFKSEYEKEERRKSQLFNPEKKFHLDLIHYNDTSLNNKFKLYDPKKKDFVNRREIFQSKISNFNIYIVYECETLNCSDYFEYIKKQDTEYYYLETTYEGFKLDHQNPDDAIQKKCKNKDKIEDCEFVHLRGLKYSLNYVQINSWRVIIYKEKKFIGKDYENSAGYIEYSDLYYSSDFSYKEIKGNNYTILNNITINTLFTEYLEYNRKKKYNFRFNCKYIIFFIKYFFYI